MMPITFDPGWDMWACGFAFGFGCTALAAIVRHVLNSKPTREEVKAFCTEAIADAMDRVLSGQSPKGAIYRAAGKITLYQKRLGEHGNFIICKLNVAVELLDRGEPERAAIELSKAIERIRDL